MEWLTREQVAKAAKESRKAALECSREHWRQLSTSKKQELADAIAAFLVDECTDFCALCARYFVIPGCSSCPLVGAGHGCNDEKSAWYTASNAMGDWLMLKTDSSWRKWKRAARRMYKVLLECK